MSPQPSETHEPYTRREADARFEHFGDVLTRIENMVSELKESFDREMSQSRESAIKLAVLDNRMEAVEQHHARIQGWLWGLSASVAAGILIAAFLHFVH